MSRRSKKQARSDVRERTQARVEQAKRDAYIRSQAVQIARSPQYNEYARRWVEQSNPAVIDHILDVLAAGGGLDPSQLLPESRLAFLEHLYTNGALGAALAQVFVVLVHEPRRFGFDSAEHAVKYLEENAPLLDDEGRDITRGEFQALSEAVDVAHLDVAAAARRAEHVDPEKQAADADRWAESEIQRLTQQGWSREKAIASLEGEILEKVNKAADARNRHAAVERAYTDAYGPGLEAAEATLQAGYAEGAFSDRQVAQFRANLYNAGRLTGEIPDEGAGTPLGSRRAMLNRAWDVERTRQAREAGLVEPLPTSTASQIRSSDGRVTSLEPRTRTEALRGRRNTRREALTEAWYQNGGGKPEFEEAWPKPPTPAEYAARDERIQSGTASRREVLEAVYTGTMPSTNPSPSENDDASTSD